MADQALACNAGHAALHALLPAPTAALSVRVVDGLRVLALRHLAGGEPALVCSMADHGLTSLPTPAACLDARSDILVGASQGPWSGADPCLLWTSPSEFLLLTTRDDTAVSVLHALRPDDQRLVYALDQSAGYVGFQLLGPGLDGLLSYLMEANTIPRQIGQASRARFMDVAVVAIRKDVDGALLLFESCHGPYVAQWLCNASQTADTSIGHGALPAR
jgi:sarcosine oxidase gamma subunit